MLKKLKINNMTSLIATSLFVLALFLLMSHNAQAADLFSTGKQAIKDTVGDDSAVETALLSAGAVGAVITGFVSKNWVLAIAGFAIGMIFWSVAAPLVGLA